jgi:hypothetical protein
VHECDVAHGSPAVEEATDSGADRSELGVDARGELVGGVGLDAGADRLGRIEVRPEGTDELAAVGLDA